MTNKQTARIISHIDNDGAPRAYPKANMFLDLKATHKRLQTLEAENRGLKKNLALFAPGRQQMTVEESSKQIPRSTYE
jgi:hypothetical protein